MSKDNRDNNLHEDFIAKTERTLKLEELIQKTELEPDNIQNNIDLGLFYLNDCNKDLAREQFEKVLLIEPFSSEALKNMGLIYAIEENYILARQYLLDAIKQVSCDIDTINMLARVCFEEKKYDEAIKYYKEAYKFKPDFSYFQEQIDLCYSLKESL